MMAVSLCGIRFCLGSLVVAASAVVAAQAAAGEPRLSSDDPRAIRLFNCDFNWARWPPSETLPHGDVRVIAGVRPCFRFWRLYRRSLPPGFGLGQTAPNGDQNTAAFAEPPGRQIVVDHIPRRAKRVQPLGHGRQLNPARLSQTPLELVVSLRGLGQRDATTLHEIAGQMESPVVGSTHGRTGTASFEGRSCV